MHTRNELPSAIARQPATNRVRPYAFVATTTVAVEAAPPPANIDAWASFANLPAAMETMPEIMPAQNKKVEGISTGIGYSISVHLHHHSRHVLGLALRLVRACNRLSNCLFSEVINDYRVSNHPRLSLYLVTG